MINVEAYPADTSDLRFSIGNAQIARVLSIGSAWSTLRFGFRLSFEDITADVIGNPALWIGVMASPASNMTNGPLTTDTTHFVGLYTSENASMVRGTGPVHYRTGAFTKAVKKTGITLATSGANSLGDLHFSAQPANLRSSFVMEIVKGSPNFTVQVACPTSAAQILDKTHAQLKTALSQTTMADVGTSLGVTVSSARSVAVSESDGALNALCLAWSRSYPPVQPYEFIFKKIA